MYVRKNFSLFSLLRTSGFHMAWMTCWGGVAVSLYEFTTWSWLAIPWLPVSLIGTAVAFYLGFKNNSSYGRMWEARKIWGGIVNSSRSLGSMVKNFTTNQFREDPMANTEIDSVVRRIVHRHIAWLYTLRHQLLQPTSWEHISGQVTKRLARMRINQIEKAHNFDPIEHFHQKYLSEHEHQKLGDFANKATHLIDQQSSDLRALREKHLIDDFRHMELQKTLNEFYVHQGKCERIKKFPFPRQYGSTSFYFVSLFIILIPFGMISEFDKLGDGLVWLTVPFTAVVGWVFLMMELVGDYSENPFERLYNDIPMYSLCRTIEIDLLQMIGEENVPEPIEAINGVLM